MIKLNNNKDIILPDARKGHENNKADTMPLDTPVKPAYDRRNASHKLLFKLDTRIESEYDNMESSSCHSGPRAGIQRDNKLMPKAFRIAQSGRSMVEMLGVLAVIGVLSIGGIMGYSYGMDKYRANTTINDINLRRIDLISQVENGNNNPTLDA